MARQSDFSSTSLNGSDPHSYIAASRNLDGQHLPLVYNALDGLRIDSPGSCESRTASKAHFTRSVAGHDQKLFLRRISARTKPSRNSINKLYRRAPFEEFIDRNLSAPAVIHTPPEAISVVVGQVIHNTTMPNKFTSIVSPSVTRDPCQAAHHRRP